MNNHQLRTKTIEAAESKARTATLAFIFPTGFVLAVVFRDFFRGDSWGVTLAAVVLVFGSILLCMWLPDRMADWWGSRAARKWDATHPKI
jgi:preprotein translocase subunit SecY